jgi:AcrR family transcriptional regulator
METVKVYGMGMDDHPLPASTDRRVRRSRRALGDALVALVLEHGFDAVTVEAIIQRADVARATFYAHFKDKADLLASLVQELAAELEARAVPLAATGPVVRGVAMRELFRHADERRELYRVALSNAAGGRAREAYQAVVARGFATALGAAVSAMSATPRVSVEVVARAWTGSHLALLDWWLNDQPQLSADEVTVIAMNLLVHGSHWGLGLDGLEFDDTELAQAGHSTA